MSQKPNKRSELTRGASLADDLSWFGQPLLEPGIDPWDPAAVRRAIARLKAELRVASGRDPAMFGQAWSSLGAAQARLGRLTRKVSLQREALASLTEACKRLNRRRDRHAWALNQERAASAHQALAMASDIAAIEDEHLAQAVASLRDAVQLTPPREAPIDWRRRQARLGETLDLLGADADEPSTVLAAIAAHKRALRTFPKSDRSLVRGDILSQLALSYANLAAITEDPRQLKRAETTNREALQVLTRRRSPTGFVRAKLSLGEILADRGDEITSPGLLAEAVACLRTAVETDVQQGKPLRADAVFLMARTLLRLGEITSQGKVIREAIDAYLVSAAAFREEGALVPALRADLNRGYALQGLGELRSDRRILVEALEVSARVARQVRRKTDDDLWADAQVAHALGLQSLGEFDADPDVLGWALTVLGKAHEVHTRESGERAWGIVEHNRATILSKRGELAGEPRDLRQAIAAFEAILGTAMSAEARAQTQNGLAVARQRLGGLLRDRALLDQAVLDYDDQLATCQQLEAPLDTARVFNNRGTVLQELGELTAEPQFFERADRSFAAALAAYPRARGPFDWAMVQLNRGGALLGYGEIKRSADILQRALTSFRAALTVYRPGRAPLEYAKTQQNVGRAQGELFALTQDRTHLLAAVRAYRSALQVLDRNGAEEQRQDTSSYLAHALVRLGRHAEAAPLIEATIARSATAIGAASRSVESHDHTVDQVGDLHALLSLCRLRQRVPEVLSALQAVEDGRARLLKADPASSDRRRARRPRLTLATLSALVPPGGALILPVLIQEAAFVFVVTEAGGLEVLERGFPDLTYSQARLQLFAINGWVDVYGETVAAPAFRRDTRPATAYDRWNSKIDRVSRWAWSALMGPLDTHLRARSRLEPGAPVILLPPGLLGPLPLAGATSDPSEAPFGARWTVSYAPSLESLAASRRRAIRAQAGHARLLAVIDPSTERAALASAREERAFLIRHFARTPPTILEGPDATPTRVIDQLPRATHFLASTHGRHDREAPRRSALALSGGALTPGDLGPAALGRMRLVYLAACESGLAGVARMEEEFIGLPTAFLQAGAACVVGSLWPVFDDAAYHLTRRFYELHLDANGIEQLAPAAAMRAAQAWLRSVTVAELQAGAASPDSALMMRETLRFTGPAAEGARSPDDLEARPYAAPHEWAGFVVFGV